jgi:hypothetical protein
MGASAIARVGHLAEEGTDVNQIGTDATMSATSDSNPGLQSWQAVPLL